VTTDQLPDNWTPLEAVAIIKCLDESGSLSYAVKSTDGLTGFECYAMLSVIAQSQARDLLDNFEDDHE
jgi:hypothetical protein